MKNKKLLPLLFSGIAYCTPDTSPLEKITITSMRACAQKNSPDKSTFIAEYDENVVVTLADATTLKADHAIITLTQQSSTTPKENKPAHSGVKDITFIGRVNIEHKMLTASADRATINPDTQQCLLHNNVHVVRKQSAQKPNDAPIDVKSNQATLSLKDATVSFEGTKEKPVITVIEFNNHQKKSRTLKTAVSAE